MYISAITLLELKTSIMRIERKDAAQGTTLRTWLEQQVKPTFRGRILPFDEYTSPICTTMHTPDPKPITDSLIAATAKQHGLTVVTCNVKDFTETGVKVFNPFEAT